MHTFNFTKILYSSALLLLIGSAANAAPCTNASLNGAYGFQDLGRHTEGTAFAEFRSIGVMTFDGRGNATRLETLWFSDLSINSVPAYQVTYTVQPDCTVSFVYVGDGDTFTGVIVESCLKLLYLETSGDPVRNGQAERMKIIQNTY